MKICSNGHTYDDSLFSVCPYCYVNATAPGYHVNTQQSPPQPVQPTAPVWQPPLQPVYAAVSTGRAAHRRKLPAAFWLVLLGVLVIAAIAVSTAILLSQDKYVINSALAMSAAEPPDGFQVFREDRQRFSFFYPEDCQTAWTDEDGAYIYGDDDGRMPYVLVYLTATGKMTPKSYFTRFTEVVKQVDPRALAGPIEEVKVKDKTLYRVRYTYSDTGDTVVLDRYLELHDGFYVQYTAKSLSEGSLDTELYYAIHTIQVDRSLAGAATGDRTVVTREHDTMRFSIDIPASLPIEELPIGYLARNEEMLFFAAYSNSDPTGAAIYDRADFIARAAEVPDWVANQIGVDTAVFENGTEQIINGVSFYRYPMHMTAGGFEGTGLLYVASAKTTGCYLICFAVSDGSKQAEDNNQLASQCADRFQVIEEPQITTFMKHDNTSPAFSVLYAVGEVPGGTEDLGYGTAFHTDPDRQAPPVHVERHKAEPGIETVEAYVRAYTDSLTVQNPDLSFTPGILQNVEDGRYGFQRCEIIYRLDGADCVNVLIGCIGPDQAIYIVSYNVRTDRLDRQQALADHLVWSLRIPD